MKKQLERNKANALTVVFILLAAIALAISIGMLFYFKRNIAEVSALSKDSEVKYSKEFAFISGDSMDDFWAPVYEEMKEYADTMGIYINWIGTNITGDHTREELIEIATDATVDGIILEADESETCLVGINNADRLGIPVVTVRNDSTYSKRKSYVGVSYYNMGQEYGNLILDVVKEILDSKEANQDEEQEKASSDESDEIEPEIKVLVLIDKNTSDTSQNTMLMAMQEQLAKEDLGEEIVGIVPMLIDNDGDFSAEESIQDVLKNPDLADIIVCLNEINTVSVYQALVEQNKVGDTVIIGYSDNITVLNAIRKNIIYATITADVKQMGKYCVDALDEYLEYGRVSDYYSVNYTTINSKNVSKYIRNEESHED